MTPDLFHSHNHPERMIRKMEQYVEKRQLCDVTLIVGSKRIPAHRLVLSAASDYFAAMFMNDVKEASMEEIRMKDVDPDAMVAIVNYAYTGQLECLSLATIDDPKLFQLPCMTLKKKILKKGAL